MADSNQHNDREEQLLAENERLQQENERLKQTNQDLHITLSTTAEHGDIVEAQLHETNLQLKAEVNERIRTQATLQALLEMLHREKYDLEVIVQTIMEHGDIIDSQWNQKLNEARLMANLDGLTQIANRRRFDEYLGLQWKQMARERSPLSILLCDIDRFKQYNDAYGHLVGDDCLQQVAHTLAECMRRPSDLISRYGGEEFAAILPQTHVNGANTVAKRIQAAIAQLQIPHCDSAISSHITLSIGVASIIPVLQDSHTALLDRADQHLYLAKQQGRNCIVSSSEACRLLR